MHRCTLASGRKRLRATSPAWCQCSSCSTFVGVSGDGIQEPPNESDASVSTLIIVFGSYALYSLSSTFTCTVPFWIRILGQNILINQSKSTEHKFGGLEALLSRTTGNDFLYYYSREPTHDFSVYFSAVVTFS